MSEHQHIDIAGCPPSLAGGTSGPRAVDGEVVDVGDFSELLGEDLRRPKRRGHQLSQRREVWMLVISPPEARSTKHLIHEDAGVAEAAQFAGHRGISATRSVH